MTHEGRGDACREVSDQDILVGDASEGEVVLKMRDVLNKGREVGVVFPFGHVFSGEPGNGITGGVMVFECGFKLLDEVRKGSNGNDPTGDSVLLEGGCQVRAEPLVM